MAPVNAHHAPFAHLARPQQAVRVCVCVRLRVCVTLSLTGTLLSRKIPAVWLIIIGGHLLIFHAISCRSCFLNTPLHLTRELMSCSRRREQIDLADMKIGWKMAFSPFYGLFQSSQTARRSANSRLKSLYTCELCAQSLHRLYDVSNDLGESLLNP